MIHEWSCPLCTLINAWEDLHCAACDYKRTSKDVAIYQLNNTLENNQNNDISITSQCTNKNAVLQDKIFFSMNYNHMNQSTWRTERRLESVCSMKATMNISTMERKDMNNALKYESQQHLYDSNIGMDMTNETIDVVETQDTNMDVEESMPSFSLFGPNSSLLQPPTVVQDVASSINEVKYDIIDSREPDINQQLSSAGLLLSDDEEEIPRESKRLRKTLPRSIEEELIQEESLPQCNENDVAIEKVLTSDQCTSVWECSVCTNFNEANLTNCELCDTVRSENCMEKDCIDLVSSQTEDWSKCGQKKKSFYEDSLESEIEECENPYSQVESVIDLDNISNDENYKEDISDSDTDISYFSTNPCTRIENNPRKRKEFLPFEHFICVEDVTGDQVNSKIDYRHLFASSRSKKTYQDRLQERLVESEKRKKEKKGFKSVLREHNSQTSKKGKQKKKPTQKNKRPVNKSMKKSGKTGSRGELSGRQNKSKPKFTSARVNHYSIADDLGDDTSCMTWEGVGSAAYSFC